MKFKKIISAVVSAAIVLSMGAVSAFATETTDFVPTENGTYTANLVEAYNYYTPTQYSMCNGVFAGEADVTIDGEWATLHLYVCNPTPKWNGLDTGILSETYITVDGTTYDGTLTSIGTTDLDAATKLFTQDSSFFGIVNGTEYTCDTMEFVIPTSALASDIEISAWVNLVMDSRQSFWLDINWLEPTTDDNQDTTPDNTVDKQDVTVSATVLSNESTYTVTVPSEIGFGELSIDSDTVVNYGVEVSNFVKGNDGASVSITSNGGQLTDGTNTIAFANSFGTQHTNGNATFNGTLTVLATDVASATAGDYTGTVTFEISTVK
ncbi:MAG: hypothetical protein R3Y35_06785 [Clostridia bacterium]